MIYVNDLVITGAQHVGKSGVEGTLLHFSTIERQDLILSHLDFHNNHIISSVIEISDTVGNLTLIDSIFQEELIHSNTQYLTIGNPYNLDIHNITMRSITDDKTSLYETPLLDIHSFDIGTTGNIAVNDIHVENCTIMFLHLHTVSGTTSSKQLVYFSNITVTNAEYETFNDIIAFGPMYTYQDVEIHLSHCTFTNLNFQKTANIIHMKQQTLDPLVLEHCLFENNIGGRIQVEPLSISDTSIKSWLQMENITVTNNDFKDSTFLVLEQNCRIEVKD